VNYRIRAAGKTLELYVYDYIGGWLGGITPQMIADDLKAAGKVDVVNVRINSPGGDVFDGITIYNLLKRHPARVEVDIDGLCGSISTIIAMAGDHVRMAQNATFMTHDPSSGCFGTATDMRKAVERLDLAKETLLDTYIAKTGGDRDHLSELMAVESWLGASAARDEGFVDEITDELEMAACFDLSKYRNAPKHLTTNGATTVKPNPFRARLASNASRVQRICG
jgi:ATP-dependent Clp protease protease subunit